MGLGWDEWRWRSVGMGRIEMGWVEMERCRYRWD